MCDRRRAARCVNAAFAALCVFIVFAPPAAFVSHKLTGWPGYRKFDKRAERRHMNMPPDFGSLPAKKWGAAVESWYNDRFAWRTEAVSFYRWFLFDIMKTHVAREVPGLDGWVFRHGGDWAELDDYLGGFELTAQEKDNWVTLFEGRRQWAEAHGAVYLQLITSVKAQIQTEQILPTIRKRRGVGVGSQIRTALEGSPAERNVVFLHDALRREVEENGRDVFFRVDHHPNAIGEFILYNELNERIREFFPEVKPIRMNGPADEFPFCTEDQGGRLAVVYPGEENVYDRILKASKAGDRYPYVSVVTDRPGEGLYVLMMHDSFMRFTLDSWEGEEGNVHFPFGAGVDRVAAFIFARATTGFMDFVMSDRIPDIIIEQFPECRLNMNIIGFDGVMRSAAMFGRGIRTDAAGAAALAPGGGRLCVRAVFDGVVSDSGETSMAEKDPGPIAAVFRRGAAELGRMNVYPGVKRAAFFGPVDPAAFVSAEGEFEVALVGGSCSGVQLSFSVVPEP